MRTLSASPRFWTRRLRDEPPSDAYAGWTRVQSAAIAIAESANLLAIPGRLCSNGQAAPVAEEDWIGWTEELGLAGYDAATNRSQECSTSPNSSPNRASPATCGISTWAAIPRTAASRSA